MATLYLDEDVIQKSDLNIVGCLDYKEVGKDIDLINYILENVLKTDGERYRFLTILIKDYETYRNVKFQETNFEKFKTLFHYLIKTEVAVEPYIAYGMFTRVKDFFKKVDPDDYYQFIERCINENVYCKNDHYYKLISKLTPDNLKKYASNITEEYLKFKLPLEKNYAYVGFVEAIQKRDASHLLNIKKLGHNLDELFEETKYSLSANDIKFYEFIKEVI